MHDIHHWALDCLTRSSFEQTPAHPLSWAQASEKGGNLQLAFKVNFLYCGVGFWIKYLLQASDSDLIIFSNKCCLDLTANRKSKLITVICSWAYSSHNYCSVAITAVPAPQMQHQKRAWKEVWEETWLAPGQEPTLSSWGQGQCQGTQKCTSAWQQLWKRKLFPVLHRTQGEKPSLHLHPSCNLGTNMCLFSWCQRKPV